MRYVFIVLISFAFMSSANAQFTHADSLRGFLSPARTCYDVRFYHLDLRVDTISRSISGSNVITFTAVSDFDIMQVDLFENYRVDSIILDGKKRASFERDGKAMFVRLPEKIKKGSKHAVKVFYGGTPQVAKRPPWDGGFTWERDRHGDLWIGVSCQGLGASSWWPNKDHQSDEPDSMLMSITVPSNLIDVSNGRLRDVQDYGDGWTKYDWFISYPINNYNVTLNIARYAYFNDEYVNSDGDTLTLDYYVLPYNLDKAKAQFSQVPPMMKIFEKHFGKYPFYRDGYKLVETPYLGMEHQSAVAYGNDYLQGYRGTSAAEVGLTFDFIIIHESAHEWWGNSVTSNDIADSWIHEGFGAYAEAVYVEDLYGYKKAMEYVNGKKPGVANDRPIIGTYGVDNNGSKDMYIKGQLILNTLRHVIDNDKLWWEIVKGIATTFAYKNIDSDDIFAYINKKTGKDYGYFFNQYFKTTVVPTLNVFISKKGPAVKVSYKWEEKGFRMPVKVTTGRGEYNFIYPTDSLQTTRFDNLDPEEFRVAEDQFFMNVKKSTMYVDPKRE